MSKSEAPSCFSTFPNNAGLEAERECFTCDFEEPCKEHTEPPMKKFCPLMYVGLMLNTVTHGSRRVSETGYSSAACPGPYCQLWVEYPNGKGRCGFVTQDIIGVEQV